MADTDAIRSTDEVSKSISQEQRKLVPVKVEPELDPIKNSTKRRKTEKSTSAKVERHNRKNSGRKKSDLNAGDTVDEQLKWCHQCHRNERYRRVVECKKCRLKNFCVTCMNRWYPDVSEEEIVEACPVCRHTCNCKTCLRGIFSPKAMQEYSCSNPDKIQYSKHILRKVFPLVSRLSAGQLMEKLIEAKFKGVPLSELQLEDAECDVDDDIYCYNCGAYFIDLYRSCACGYDLCLVCCRDLRNGNLDPGGKGVSCGWKSYEDGSMPCPPEEIGGCNDGILELKRIMPVDWLVNFLEKAQGLYKINRSDDIPETCTECYDSGNEALVDEKCHANYLYSFSAKDIKPGDMQHFQLHWSKGEPLIVSDVFSTSTGLSWEPMVLWRAFRNITRNRSQVYEVNAINCLDWSEVTVDLYKFFKGYSEGQFKREGRPMILKLEDWQPSCLSEGEWRRHFVELIGCLPFKDYTHPNNGYLNIAVKLPDQSLKPDMGPKMDIAYGFEEEWEYGNSVTKLHYDKADTVNILTHTKSALLTSTNINYAKTVKQKHSDQDESDAMKEAVLWDIFQRKDIPKLEKYLRTHSAELNLSVEQIVHPIHDRVFYLNMEQKQKLKEEFGIKPWSFKQKMGDAVFIPAGCPYQVRNLKSNTKVELNFVSPESLGECIRLQQEIHMLPSNHRAKQDKLNIRKMMLYALEHAVGDLVGVGDSNGLEFTKVPETSNGYHANLYNQTNGWLNDTENNASALNRFNQEELQTKLVTISSDLSTTIINYSSLNNGHKVMQEPTAHEDGSTLPDKRTLDDPQESVGLWRGIDVGPEAKELLEAVERCYPHTFKRVQFRTKANWRSLLNQLHEVLKLFIEISVETLAEEMIINLREHLKECETFGFDLSWAHNRLDMVHRMKFGNEPLHQELMALEESLEPLKERLGDRWKQLAEAHEMLKKAQLEYENATDARNKKAQEVAQKFGAEYDDVLKGDLGFGMLPGYNYVMDVKYGKVYQRRGKEETPAG